LKNVIKYVECGCRRVSARGYDHVPDQEINKLAVGLPTAFILSKFASCTSWL
jgi:hypothetical protein